MSGIFGKDIELEAALFKQILQEGRVQPYLNAMCV